MREQFEALLKNFYDRMYQAVETGDSTWLDPVLDNWLEAMPESEGESQDFYLLLVLNQIQQTTYEIARENLDLQDAVNLIEVLTPIFLHANEYSARSEHVRKITDICWYLENANKALERLEKSKSKFIAIAAHELRTPLNHIIGFTELVTDKRFGELNATQQEYLNDVLASSKFLLSLITDILDAWLPARRWVRMLVQVSILGVIVATAGAVGFIEYSAQPSFCDNCHIMKPYYDSWQLSSHQDVPCIQCHYAPGIKAEAMGKFQAANQVVKYVTGVYGMKPWAEIDDAACLRSGCHVEARLSSVVDFEGIPFTHAKHLGELRRGKQLRCTSCHSQMVPGSHPAVTRETCILCHLRTGRPVSRSAGAWAVLRRRRA